MIKNSLISMQKGFLTLMSATLLFSCSQIDAFEAEDMFTLRSSAIVQEACYEGDVSSIVTFSGAYQNKQTVSLNVSNDTDFVYLDFTSSTSILFINGERVNKKDGMYSTKLTHAEFNELNTFEVRRTGEGHGACAPGNCMVLDASEYVIVEPCDDDASCTASVTVNHEGEGVYEFTFTPSVTENVISMTLAQADRYTVLDGKTWTSRDQGKGNQIVWTGELTSCESTTFRMKIEGSCGTNLVTNFNVNGDDLLKENIRAACQ